MMPLPGQRRRLEDPRPKNANGTEICSAKHTKLSYTLDQDLKTIKSLFDLPRRTDVNAVTNWNAPLVWEGTFDPVVIDAIYKKMDPRVAVLVFAVGKYTRFLKGFLESAEKYFLVDFRVTYYIFTDNEKEVPKVKLGRGRNIAVVPIPGVNRWQDEMGHHHH
ncbi:hypothetical protein NQZ68_017693 [Dissostichus eleginoides]|nr:hypothetical protein NQZ68_017693 [Dissostichus eleginoides]